MCARLPAVDALPGHYQIFRINSLAAIIPTGRFNYLAVHLPQQLAPPPAEPGGHLQRLVVLMLQLQRMHEVEVVGGILRRLVHCLAVQRDAGGHGAMVPHAMRQEGHRGSRVGGAAQLIDDQLRRGSVLQQQRP